MSEAKVQGGVSIIVRQGDYESAHYALALASAALAVNRKAVLFFTMAGIRALTGPPPGLDDWGRDAINRERGVGDFLRGELMDPVGAPGDIGTAPIRRAVDDCMHVRSPRTRRAAHGASSLR